MNALRLPTNGARRLVNVHNIPEFLYAWRDALSRIAHGRLRIAFPLSMNDAPSPFFIVGAGRSGNTLLRRMLMASGAVYIPEESYFIRALIKNARSTTCSTWEAYVENMLQIVSLNSDAVLGREQRAEFESLCLSLPPNRQCLAAIIDIYYRLKARHAGRADACWGDKTPMYTYSVNALLTLFPKARFIHVLRDGVDVVASYVEAGLVDSLSHAADRWVSSVKRLAQFQKLYPSRIHVVRYEALVTHPYKTLEDVCQFLNIAFSDSMVNGLAHVRDMGDVPRLSHHAAVMQPISSSGIGKGRRAFSVSQRKRLSRLLDNELTHWGYSPAGVS